MGLVPFSACQSDIGVAPGDWYNVVFKNCTFILSELTDWRAEEDYFNYT